MPRKKRIVESELPTFHEAHLEFAEPAPTEPLKVNERGETNRPLTESEEAFIRGKVDFDPDKLFPAEVAKEIIHDAVHGKVANDTSAELENSAPLTGLEIGFAERIMKPDDIDYAADTVKVRLGTDEPAQGNDALPLEVARENLLKELRADEAAFNKRVAEQEQSGPTPGPRLVTCLLCTRTVYPGSEGAFYVSGETVAVPDKFRVMDLAAHNSCVALLLRQYHMGMYPSYVTQPPAALVQQASGPVQMSSISLIQNTKREYHHEIKLYVNPAWPKETTENVLYSMQEIAHKAEERDLGEYRVEINADKLEEQLRGSLDKIQAERDADLEAANQRGREAMENA